MTKRIGAARLVVISIACLMLSVGVARGADAPMKIGTICEQRMQDDALAVVIPQRRELMCRMGGSPWGFGFAGFETTWRGELEVEVSGSGDFKDQDVFTLAAIGIDYGSKAGWTERSLFGVGKLGGYRAPHPPNWGAGGGKVVVRTNLASAKPEAQRVKIDLEKYAPKDWDGRIWVGLYLHNVGSGKWIKARIVNSPASDVPAEPDEKAMWELVRQHQKMFLESALKKMKAMTPDQSWVTRVDAEVRPYAEGAASAEPEALAASQIRQVLENYDKQPTGALDFLKLSEGYFAWTRRAGSEGDRAAPYNDLLRTWKDGGEVGRDIGCIVRVATNAQKIALADVTSGRVVTRENKPIQISAARHEYEGFQVVLTPLAQTRGETSVTVSDLTSEQGGETIARENVKVNAVGYVRIFPNEAREMLVGDPLLDGPIPELAAGENQPVWVTVYVPSDARPGTYRGTVTVARGDKKIEIPLSLKVWDFNIPEQISLRSSFWMFRDQINRFYHLKEVALDDYFAWIDMALQHRLNPIDVYEGQCEQLLDLIIDPKTGKPGQKLKGVPNPKPDFSKWDRYLDRMVAGGANTLNLGQSHHQGTFFAGDGVTPAEQIERVKQGLITLRDHYQKRGLLKMHYVQLRDETSAPESLNVYRGIKQSLPELKLLLTAPSKEAKPLLDIPCPLSPGFDAKWRDETKKRPNGEYWWYVCVQPNDPRFANFFIQQTAAQHRALFWQTWGHEVDGLLYWGMNFWSWYEYKWPAGVIGPTKRVPAKGDPNFVSVPEAPGDGCSMYPGKDAAHPLSSVRLECMRDGEEDYEYLRLLDRLIAEHPDRATDAKRLRDEAKHMVENMTDYPNDGESYLNMRTQLAEAIEKLGGQEK